jgi:hypothetical protein
MPLIREQMNNRAVKKTLTIPKWLNDEAEKAGVNFSHSFRIGLGRCSVLGIREELERIWMKLNAVMHRAIP